MMQGVARLPNVLHVLLFLLSLSMAFGFYNGTLFGWHPFCMAIGFVFFMGEGLISAWAIRTTAGEERVRGLEMHAIMQLRALLLIAIGAGVIIHNKNLHGKPHFASLHGKVGLLTLILTGLSPVLGTISFRKLGIIQRFPDDWQPRLKKAHKVLGVVTWALSLLTIEIVLPKASMYKRFVTPMWQAGTLAAAALMGALLYGRVRRQTVLKGT